MIVLIKPTFFFCVLPVRVLPVRVLLVRVLLVRVLPDRVLLVRVLPVRVLLVRVLPVLVLLVRVLLVQSSPVQSSKYSTRFQTLARRSVRFVQFSSVHFYLAKIQYNTRTHIGIVRLQGAQKKPEGFMKPELPSLKEISKIK